MNRYRIITRSALSAAILCILSPISIPVFGPIPLTLTTLVIYLFAIYSDIKTSVFSIIVYIFLGIIGLPVFSGFSGGIGVVTSITGGYIIGYIPMIILLSSGKLISKGRSFPMLVFMLLSTMLLYIIGTSWYIAVSKASVHTAFTICVLPFLPGDIFKILISLLLYKKLK